MQLPRAEVQQLGNISRFRWIRCVVCARMLRRGSVLHASDGERVRRTIDAQTSPCSGSACDVCVCVCVTGLRVCVYDGRVARAARSWHCFVNQRQTRDGSGGAVENINMRGSGGVPMYKYKWVK